MYNKLAARKLRSRARVRKTANDRLRLSVHRTGQHIYAQIIDDVSGLTIASANTLEKDIKAKAAKSWTVEAAQAVGEVLAERAKTAGVSKLRFDRGILQYHGRVKALADGARSGGMDF